MKKIALFLLALIPSVASASETAHYVVLKLREAGYSVAGARVTDSPKGISLSFPQGTTASKRSQAQAAADALDVTPATVDAYIAGLNLGRKQALNVLTDKSADAQVMRAMVLAESDWFTLFKSTVAASSSLADLKAKVSTLPSTPAQIKSLIKSNLDSGAAD